MSPADPMDPNGLDIAVIGSGIAGMAAAWLLCGRHRLTVLEADDRPGGHTHTVEAMLPDGRRQPVDTGFIVYNTVNYPNLVALFDHVNVKTEASAMSFAVSVDGGALEYSGSGLGGLLAQPANALRPRFWWMMGDLVRFYREAPGYLADPACEEEPLGAFLAARGYGTAFLEDHLMPMGAAIWSSSLRDMRAFPAAAFIRFFDSHALLRLSGRPVWRTVSGGSREYLRRLTAPFADRMEVGVGARRITRSPAGPVVEDTRGQRRRFDAVVLATHADQALALLDDPDPDQRRLLGAFRYQANEAWLHRDPSLMPRRRRAWAAWNYLLEREGPDDGAASVTYWMNRLQNIDSAFPLFVTLNPPRPPAPSAILRQITYDHPVFDAGAVAAQKDLWRVQGRGGVWLCGSYFGHGFHEDALQSGLLAAERLGGVRRPWTVPRENGRLAPWPAEVRHQPLDGGIGEAAE